MAHLSPRQEGFSLASGADPNLVKLFFKGAGALVGTLTNLGGGKYAGQFSLATNPQRITVQSSLGETATQAVK